MSNLKLPNIHMDAKSMIADSLRESGRLSLKKYGSLFSNQCEISHFHIEEVEDEEGYANLDLVLVYKSRQLSPNNTFDEVERARKFRVLNSQGDIGWTYRMQNLVWEGEYPSTVAVDIESGEVFLFSITSNNRAELVEFGLLEPSEFETLRLELNDREPFKIKIAEDAMFRYIDGAEGVNHLKQNIQIEFNCGLPIRVTNKILEVI